MKLEEKSVDLARSLLSSRLASLGAISRIFANEMFEEDINIMLQFSNTFDDVYLSDCEERLQNNLSKISFNDLNEYAQKTRTEYARLFIGPRKVLAPMHASVYWSGSPRMFTQETLRVRALYQQFGFEMKMKNRMPEDSIDAEFEFLYRTTLQLLDLINSSVEENYSLILDTLEAQESFIKNHLTAWLPMFVERVETHDRCGLYSAWAVYANDYLYEDLKVINRCKLLFENSD